MKMKVIGALLLAAAFLLMPLSVMAQEAGTNPVDSQVELKEVTEPLGEENVEPKAQTVAEPTKEAPAPEAPTAVEPVNEEQIQPKSLEEDGGTVVPLGDPSPQSGPVVINSADDLLNH